MVNLSSCKIKRITLPNVRIELTAFRFLVEYLDYETNALPTELTGRHATLVNDVNSIINSIVTHVLFVKSQRSINGMINEEVRSKNEIFKKSLRSNIIFYSSLLLPSIVKHCSLSLTTKLLP